jgi:hypothetical protein
LDFWKKFDGNKCCNVAIRCYCPSLLKKNIHDIYDNISYALYDFHDTIQDHIAYLSSMKIYDVYDPKYETLEMSCYKDYMKLKPEEYVLIPDVMEALLHQVEENLRANEKTATAKNQGNSNYLKIIILSLRYVYK